MPQEGINLKNYGTICVAPKSLRPSRVITDSFDNDLEISYDFQMAEGDRRQIALIGTGSFTSAEECLDEFVAMRDDYEKLVDSTTESFRQY